MKPAALPFAQSGLERWGRTFRAKERSRNSLGTAKNRRFQVAHWYLISHQIPVPRLSPDLAHSRLQRHVSAAIGQFHSQPTAAATTVRRLMTVAGGGQGGASRGCEVSWRFGPAYFAGRV